MVSRYSNIPMPNPHGKYPPDEQRKHVAIFAAEGLTSKHWLWMCEKLDRAVIAFDHPYILVRGWGNGAEQLVLNWATYNWYVMRVFYPHSSDTREARRKRDEEMLAAATHVVALTDGKCSWIYTLVEDAREAGLKARVFRL